MFLPKTLDGLIHRALGAAGYALVRREHLSLPLDRRARMIQAREIDLVIDVGANEGQYGRAMRKLGFAGRIASFEPMRGPCQTLKAAAVEDGNWTVYAFGLGDEHGIREINISQNSVSSSLLKMLSEHEKFAPRSQYVGSESIEIRRLDDVFAEVSSDAKHIWLKIDVQGFEDRVLRGASAVLSRIEFVQIELSLRPLYDGQQTYRELASLLECHGFTLVGIEPGFLDKDTGELLQIDGIFRRIAS